MTIPDPSKTASPFEAGTPAPSTKADAPAKPPRARTRPLRHMLLWLVAATVMLGSYSYQKRTGPTYPLRGQIKVEGGSVVVPYSLVRSQETTSPARVTLPDLLGEGAKAEVTYRRYPTDDAWTMLPMVSAHNDPDAANSRSTADGDPVLAAELPIQPAAGKIEYYITITEPNGMVAFRIPDAVSPPDTLGQSEEKAIILRYKDPVPDAILIPHIIMMFFSILLGIRAGLAALFESWGIRRWLWIAFIGMSVGGMILGPIVQKYAFGVYWSGFPDSSDLTDNKMLVMWLTWLVAVLVAGLTTRPLGWLRRGAVVVAAVVMFGVYLIPHSMRGSELNYDRLEEVADPHEAIGTGS